MTQLSYYESEGVLVRRKGVAMTEVWGEPGGWLPFSIDTGTAAFRLSAAQAKQQFPAAFADERTPRSD